MSEQGTCPECGGDLVKRNGKYGEFLGCSNFPDCRYIKKDKSEVKFDPELGLCPQCSEPLVKKNGKKGEFIACSAFPNCKYTKSINSINSDNDSKSIIFIDEDYGNCPNCGSPLIKKEGKRGSFLSCSSFPKCKFSMDYKEGVKVDFNEIDRCPKCGSALVKKEGKFGAFMSCSAFPNCRFSMDVKD